MSSRPFKLALGQMRVKPGQKNDNLARAVAMIRNAAEEGASMILLPEALTVGWTDRSATGLADEVPGGESFTLLSEQARKTKIHVCAGLIERAGDRIFNSAVLIDPAGRLLAHHRKINELAIAHDLYAPGDRLQVVETEFGKVGLMICADAFVRGQVISRALAVMGAQIILSPCAWAVPPEHDNQAEPYGGLWLENYGPVAREFQLWIAGASCTGPVRHGAWAGWNCIGASLLVDPQGEKILQGPYGAETILYAEIEARAPARAPGEPGR